MSKYPDDDRRLQHSGHQGQAVQGEHPCDANQQPGGNSQEDPVDMPPARRVEEDARAGHWSITPHRLLPVPLARGRSVGDQPGALAMVSYSCGVSTSRSLPVCTTRGHTNSVQSSVQNSRKRRRKRAKWLTPWVLLDAGNVSQSCHHQHHFLLSCESVSNYMRF